MTLSSLLSPSVAGPGGDSQIPPPDIDRTEWGWSGGSSGGGGGGWKGGKGNPNAALSALTLLAFLFFLNVLQSCLKDTMNQNPGVVVMMMPTPAAAVARNKRAVQSEKTMKITAEKYNDDGNNAQITELVHDQVESYWSNTNNEFKSIKNNKKKQQQNILGSLHDTSLLTNRISTKLNTSKATRKYKPDKCTDVEILHNLVSHKAENEENYLRKVKQPTTSWMTIAKVLNMSKPFVRKILCCDVVVCENIQIRGISELHSISSSVMRKILHWFCGLPKQNPCTSSQYALSNCKNSLVRSILQIVEE